MTPPPCCVVGGLPFLVRVLAAVRLLALFLPLVQCVGLWCAGIVVLMAAQDTPHKTRHTHQSPLRPHPQNIQQTSQHGLWRIFHTRSYKYYSLDNTNMII
jgi:hypothetical protein